MHILCVLLCCIEKCVRRRSCWLAKYDTLLLTTVLMFGVQLHKMTTLETLFLRKLHDLLHYFHLYIIWYAVLLQVMQVSETQPFVRASLATSARQKCKPALPSCNQS